MNLHLFNPRGPDRVAAISTREVWGSPGMFTLVVSRGSRRGRLQVGPQVGPVHASLLDAEVQRLVSQLAQEGFAPSGQATRALRLRGTIVRERAQAARAAGWLRERALVDALLTAGAAAGPDLSTVVEALGRIGDARALPLLREEAERKLLSRRRAGAEALRVMGDAVGLAGVTQRARERLPDAVRDAWDRGDAAALEASFKQVDAKDLGLALDSLYDLGTPLAVDVTRALLRRVVVHQPHFWRYAKSLLKRAMARVDGETFAILVRRIELAARTARGTRALLKSGLDGQTRQTRVFSVTTQRYVMRRAWRWMRRLAEHQPQDYARVGAEVLAVWQPEDREKPRGQFDEWSRAYVFNKVLRGQSAKIECVPRNLRFRIPYNAARIAVPAGARAESYPECWDATPAAYLTVLAKARVIEAQAFAEKAVRARHTDALAQAPPHTTILAMLSAPYDGTVDLALTELERRFDPKRPDWSLLDAMVADAREPVRERALRFVMLCADAWTRDVDRALALMGSRDARLAATAAGLMVIALTEADPWMRRELAERCLSLLQQPEAFEGAHDGVGRVARESLAAEISAGLGLDEVMALVRAPSPAAQALGGELLGRRPEAAKVLGPDQVLAMAMHDVAAVRRAAMGLLRTDLDALRADPSPLFALADGEWDDTRAVVFDLLRDAIDVGALGIAGIISLCDANRAEVQAFGREMALKHFDRLDPQDLIQRLAQHPAPPMRRFAMDLVAGHLKEGFVALAKLEGFFRRALLDLRPSRAEKRRVMAFLLARGLRDERQAELAARVLGEVARTRCATDTDAALEALVKLQLTFPEVESPLSLGGAP
ncbi:MAG: hypothetical protein U0325_30095 [Polyangiales bacterium]